MPKIKSQRSSIRAAIPATRAEIRRAIPNASETFVHGCVARRLSAAQARDQYIGELRRENSLLRRAHRVKQRGGVITGVGQ